MSVWSSLEGVIDIKRGVHCSVLSCIKEVFDEYRKPLIVQTEHADSYRVHLTLEFCEDGQSALDLSRQLIVSIKTYDKNAYVDLTFTTRLF